MIKLDGFFHTIHKDIGLAVSLKDIMLSLRLRTISFKIYSLTNIFVYRAQSIQFYIKLESKMQYGFLHMLMRSKVTYQGQGSSEVKLGGKCLFSLFGSPLKS